jgi:hypothetical protein
MSYFYQCIDIISEKTIVIEGYCLFPKYWSMPSIEDESNLSLIKQKSFKNPYKKIQ